MKISIIVPTVRQEKMLDFQLPNYAKQTFPKEEFEIIIIDDYIDDIGNDRRDRILNFGNENRLNIKWIRSKKPYYRSQANIGCARNTGLVHAQGELIVFNDDFSGVRHKYLEKVWSIYMQDKSFSHIGPVISVEYGGSPSQDNINNLRLIRRDERSTRGKNTRLGHRLRQCSSSWFYTSNASAPLKDIIKVNGFWEMADLTREEDVLMGVALEKVGRKFCFVDNTDIGVYHMVHLGQVKKNFTDVTYESIGWPTANIDGRIVEGGGKGGKCGLDTNSDNIQLVTKDIFGTKYPGSWALIEHFEKNKNLKFNQEIGFNLVEERKNIGNWI